MPLIHNDIQEDYCSLEVSKLLKDIGFKYRVGGLWWGIDKRISNKPKVFQFGDMQPSKKAIAPYVTHALAIKWIRENFDINITASCNSSFDKWKFQILRKFPDETYLTSDDCGVGVYAWYDNETEAIEAALLYTLNNLIP